ncbi:hypothetical protein HHI36_000127 [Cryptolaemus montrouzieri]|uniref:Uncharacterized protein n=1 Tax=Cryptolaemus montrouzieri TaxID=559131 RepID=A0ABD2P3P8_9CUCU
MESYLMKFTVYLKQTLHSYYLFYLQGDKHSGDYWKYINHLEKILSANNVDPTTCMQRLVCSAISHSLVNIKKGQATSSDKIIDGVSSSSWLLEQLQGTPMYFAVQDGLDGHQCDQIYTKCNLPTNTVESVVDTFQKLTMS